MSTAGQSPVYGDIIDVGLNQELSIKVVKYSVTQVTPFYPY